MRKKDHIMLFPRSQFRLPHSAFIIHHSAFIVVVGVPRRTGRQSWCSCVCCCC